MPKVWNIGNTTVRNPKRIENALRVFVEEGFSGNARGSEIEARLHSKLKEREVLEFDGNASDWNGRKWRSAFYQLGFISYDKYDFYNEIKSVEELFQNIGMPDIVLPYQLTLSGEKLINAKKVAEIEDIYLRQFCCYELPNSLEKNFASGRLKPFILFLQVLCILESAGLEGLTKFETGLFIQSFRNHTETLASEIVNEITEYRDRISKSSTSKEIKMIREIYLSKLASFSGINPNSIVNDYADTTFRYFSLSGLFTRVGETIVIRENKRNIVAKILEETHFLFSENPIEYFKKFYRNNYKIPTDNIQFAIEEIEMLKAGIRSKTHPLVKEANKINIGSEINIVQNLRYLLIEYNNWEKEVDFANEQQNENSIKEILQYLKTLNNEPLLNNPEIDDRPSFLEWSVWRSFLAIDEIKNPIHLTRRFQVDQDFMPRNTAPGGGADLIFEFDTYVLVVEVTMTKSNRQMAVESEPVRRHTVFHKLDFPSKDVYCLFIAPSVDNNVAETFRIGVWYNGDEEEFLNVIPMSLSDYISIIETLLDQKFKNEQFKSLLDRCLIFRNVRAPQWKQNISKEVVLWKKKLIKN